VTKDLLARLGRAARKTGRALLWLVALLVGVHAVWGYLEARRLERAIAGIRAKGEPTRWADLEKATPAVEDVDNAGRFYSAALALTVPGAKPLRQMNPFRAAHDAGPGEEPTPEQRTAVQAHLERNQVAFEMLDRGSQLPACRFTEWNEGELPPLLPMRVLAELSSLRVGDLAFRGQGRLAFAAWFGFSRFLRIFDARVPLIGYLIRGALLDHLTRDVPMLLERGALDEKDLMRLEEKLRDLDRPQAMTDALVAERTWGLEGLIGHGWGGLAVRPGVSLSLDGPFWKHETVAYIESMQALIEVSRQPAPASLQAAKTIRPRGWVARIALPSLERPLASDAETVARLRTAQAAAGVARYRLAHGHPPGQLSELTPAFDALDPFTGRPLLYRGQADGFRIYSTGLDGRDDGGQVEGSKAIDLGLVVRWSPATKAGVNRPSGPAR
jgi:hypothetical protein